MIFRELLTTVKANMAIFQSKRFRPSSYSNTVPARYRNALARHPFALFGLPFIATMLLGSFFLTPATALRYERHDRKVRQMSEEEKLGIGKDKRKIDIKEEYYVSFVAGGSKEVPLARCVWSADVMMCRDWQQRTSTIGSRKESSACLARLMG